MSKEHQRKQHVVDFVFAITLFFVFAVSALMVVAVALQSYRSIQSKSEENYRMRTASSYLSQKLRYHDTPESIKIIEIDGTQALSLTELFDAEEYQTYIYEYDGEIKELFVKSGTDVSLESGKGILAVSSLEMTEKEAGLFSFSMIDSNGKPYELTVATRS